MSETVVPLQKHESWTKGGPVVSHLRDDEISLLGERASATIGDPATLGLWGFATGTWITGTVIAGAFPTSALTACIPVLIVFAGMAQFIAGLYAFRRTNILASTAFCCFGAFNVTAAFFFALQAANTIGTTGAPMVLLGFLLESFGFIAFALAVAAIPTNAALVTVLGTLSVGYFLTGIPHLVNASGGSGWAVVGSIGGWFLVASAFFAYYTGMAMVVNSTWHRTILPIGGEP
ncbi:MAG TPA: acetate uptake transporter [Pseudolabrys sp.]|nr:acetate uptake transporter [Pseudolabrys sp.]